MEGLLEENLEDSEICIIFPVAWHKFCDVLAYKICKSFKVKCLSVKYQQFSQGYSSAIRRFLRKGKILVVGYVGVIGPEIAYKIGFANAFDCQILVVRLDLLPGKDPGRSAIPEYISCHGLINGGGDIEVFVNRFENAISVILSRNIESMLYQKVLHECCILERDSGIDIQKVDRETFAQNLRLELRRRGILFGRQVLYNLYINNDSELADQLIILVCKNELEMLSAFSQCAGKLSLESPYSQRGIYISGGSNIIQHGSGDNVAGDSVQGDKNTPASE